MSVRAFISSLFIAASLAASADTEPGDMGYYEVNEIIFNESDLFGPALEKLLARGLSSGDDGDDTAESEAIADEIIGYAKGFLGTRYRRGGKTPKGFDCSGFTSYVFRNFGYSLGPASYVQGTQGEPVSGVLEARPGDLIFFSGSRAGSRVGHVGLVVDVDPRTGVVKFIHSSIQKGVVIDQYPDGGYYSRRFIGVRRVL